MCNPASFIITRTAPETIRVYWSKLSDSHEEIISEFGLDALDKKGTAKLVRVEITPPYADYSKPLDEWEYCVDQDETPAWYDAIECEERIRQALPDWLAEKVVMPGSEVAELNGGNLVAVYGKILRVSDSATIQHVYDSATIQHVYDSATIQRVSGSATIQRVYGNATIQYVYGNATIQRVSGSAIIQDVSGNATIQDVSGSAIIQYVYGNATIQDVSDNATIQRVSGSAIIQYVYGNATIQDVSGSATIQGVYGRATVITSKKLADCALAGLAVIVDRSGDKPVLITAEG